MKIVSENRFSGKTYFYTIASRKTVGGAILDPEDVIGAVLDDNDFVSIGELLSGVNL